MHHWRFRSRVFIMLLVLVPAGFLTKSYTGPAQDWVRFSLGGVLYELFWCLLIALRFPGIRPAYLAAGVLIATCLLEFLQLWHPAPLEAIRATLIGRTLLGTTFTWLDFPHYLAGSLGGYWILRRLQQKYEKRVLQ